MTADTAVANVPTTVKFPSKFGLSTDSRARSKPISDIVMSRSSEHVL